jgi:hypothetical protein
MADILAVFSMSQGPSTPRICFVSASGQNVFFEELLDAMRDELDRAGVTTLAAVDALPPVEDDLVYVLVPHEFMPLTQPHVHPTPEQYARTIAICTEQPQTIWFDRAAAISGHCGVTIDINPLGVEALKRRDIDARLMQLGHVPAWDHWGGDEDVERDVDVTFMGGHTPRRAAILARMAGFLDGRRAALHVFETAAPHTKDSKYFLSGERKWAQLRRAKLIVNIHRDELGYFEWQRALGAMANGCVVVTEHSIGCAPLVPGEHFISTGYDSIPHAVEALLADEGRLAEIRQAAYAMLRGKLQLADSIGVIREAAVELAAAAPPTTEASRRPKRPAPRRPPPRPLAAHVIMSGRDGEQAIRMAVKHLLLEQRALRRELDIALDRNPPPELTTRTFGPWERANPRVSVLLSLYNYANVVGRAMRSVAAGTFQDVELIVVDDGSRDGSAEAVARACEELWWLPVKLLVRGRNAGLAAARTLAAEHARADYLFVLDADNEVLPHGIERLVAALDADPDAAFSYGVLQRVTSGVPDDIMSWLGWEPERLRHGNFVDAMTLLRRDVLLSAGGYPSDPRLYGWEDFALWCELAERGHRGAQVLEMVARYHAAAHSMISITNIDSAEAWAALARRHPFLDGAELEPAR